MPSGPSARFSSLALTSQDTNCLCQPARRDSSGPALRGTVPRWKRVLDITCIIVAGPLLFPIGLLIAVAIKIISPGPVFFKQERIGFLGRRFLCLKFRT